MAYFAQFALDVEGVAMVTASHNDNGWTGIKMGMNRPLTFGPEEMSRLKEIVLGGNVPSPRPGAGSYHFVENFGDRYIASLTDRPNSSASSKSSAPAATARQARSRPKCSPQSVARGHPPRLSNSTTHSRATIPTPKT